MRLDLAADEEKTGLGLMLGQQFEQWDGVLGMWAVIEGQVQIAARTRTGRGHQRAGQPTQELEFSRPWGHGNGNDGGLIGCRVDWGVQEWR
jgi:hypothetical protein